MRNTFQLVVLGTCALALMAVACSSGGGGTLGIRPVTDAAIEGTVEARIAGADEPFRVVPGVITSADGGSPISGPDGQDRGVAEPDGTAAESGTQVFGTGEATASPDVVLSGTSIPAGLGQTGAEVDPPDDQPTIPPSPALPTTPEAIAAPISPSTQPSGGDAATVPADLALPFDASVTLQGREFMTPFGVYRKSADRPGPGHSGIDVPMANGAPMYAVAAGRVLNVEPSSDQRLGETLKIMIGDEVRPGEGWTFIYEHVAREPGITQGATVQRGQLIGTNAMATGESNNHLQLTYQFNEQGFTRDHTCWVDQLSVAASDELDVWFAALKGSDFLLSGWRTATDEEYYPFRGLLDETAYPDGPRLCYAPGTDVREHS
ncbi:MAG: peptidoglycan DD-metalloendopeptidase family protein [Chloroflexi bacterium]|nr:peptidoglycan DD-metalloendopeptidase family protein [Chloroflexota bacterium]